MVLARFLIEHGANATAQYNCGSTPLHLAAHHRHVDLARLLVQHGVDVETQDKDGPTLLHLAVQEGRVDLTRLFNKPTADVRARIKAAASYDSSQAHRCSS